MTGIREASVSSTGQHRAVARVRQIAIYARSSRSCICRYGMLSGICAVQIQSRKYVLDRAGHEALTRQHDLYTGYADQS